LAQAEPVDEPPDRLFAVAKQLEYLQPSRL
jgi:hypothetical protein